MVGMEVRENHHHNRVHVEPTQASVHQPRVRAGVDDNNSRSAGREHQAISLPHVAGDEQPAPRRPPRSGCGHGDDDDQQDHATKGQPGPVRQAPYGGCHHDGQDGEQCGGRD
jgi:hypothetical protein